MTAIRAFGIPAFVVLVAYLSWDYANHPGRYQDMGIRAKVTPLKPDSRLPTFSSVGEQLGGKAPANDTASRFGKNEPILKTGRDNIRQSTLRALDQAWSTHCTAEGRKRIIASLNEYFWASGTQKVGYPNRFGRAGADYIEQEWSTADDRRIGQQVVQLYERGYIDLAGFKRHIAEYMAPLLKDARVQGQPCKG